MSQRSKILASAATCPPPAGRFFFRTNTKTRFALGGEVRDVLSDDSPALGPGGRRDLRIGGCPQAHLSDVDSIAAVPGAQEPGRGYRKHLVDQEGGHARSAARCLAVWRFRSPMARLRSIRSPISPECSAA